MKRNIIKKRMTIPESVSQHIEEEYKKSPDFRKAYDEEIMMLKIAYKISQLRKHRHITQSALARMTGTTQQTISRLEDSKNTQVTLHTLAKLAKALHARINIDLAPL